MTTDVILTGTGYPRPHPDRAGPGVLVRGDGFALQFDAGRGTALRLAACGVSCRDLSALFITHHHSDHLVDIPDVALTRWTVLDRDREDSPLIVVAPEGPSARFARRMLEPYDDDIAVRVLQTGRATRPDVEVRAFEPADTPCLAWSQGAVRVLARTVRHEPVRPAVAYRVETPDGVVVVSGDTAACEEVAGFAAGADVLVHEVIRTSRMAGTRSAGIAHYHADSVALGRVLAGSAVPLLLLTHIIPAPRDADDERALVDEVRSGGYRGEIRVGHDGLEVTLPAVPPTATPRG